MHPRRDYHQLVLAGWGHEFLFLVWEVEDFFSGYFREEILEAIHTVMRGKTYLSEEASQVLRKSADNGVPVLTRREKEILENIAEGLTNNEIAQKLFISVATVDTHRKNLLAKFEAKNIASLIKSAMKLQMI